MATGIYGWSDAPDRVPFVQPPMTAEDWASVEEARRETDAIDAFMASHTRAEVAARREEARRNPRWRRWWEPGPSRKWSAQEALKRAVAAKYGAAVGQVVPVACPRCGASGEIQWKGSRARFVGMHIDHIRARSRGGDDGLGNLRLLCAACNLKKHAKVEG
jgi:5-methylcytosine-specific restriction endonuclease McrA